MARHPPSDIQRGNATSSRRDFVMRSLVAAALLPGCSRETHSGPFPSRDIDFIIPTGAGGGADVYARLIGSAMEKHLPRQVNIIPFNVPSGGGGKGVTQLFRAAADGYAIGILNIPGIFVLQRARRMPYDLGQFSWLGLVTEGEHYGLAVRASSPILSIDQLRALSRRRELTFSASGPEGTAYSATVIGTRLLGLRNRMVTGYKGSNDYVIGCMRGDSDAVVAALSVIHRMQQGGALRVLATFEEKSSLPGVPDATALGQPELAMITAERAIAAPPGLPAAERDILAGALAKAAVEPQLVSFAKRIRERLNPQSPEQTSEIVRRKREFFERFHVVAA